ncbi:hypothetical protein [Aidingimonas halophila]|uniref:Uncharacterized protein n=1 Tax=Aidingimonas halophila TaxID=574349 RepID=A0A1H2X9W6_9GAMM|nr:hypothetical protein [Aidingimonas halophila]GHC28379.1 hypothetical protein GCM10008094_20260 [Aidingimonas halophila]SDW89548.1 hypothetical protein SAMN05443545_103143 [Aidingimonas halophila]
MLMPFEVWKDDSPTRLTIVKVNHPVYLRLERCYFGLKRIMGQEPDEVVEEFIQTIREVLTIGYTQPLRDWTSTMGVDLPRLYQSIEDISQGYPDAAGSLSELRLLIEELERSPVTLVQAALEKFFLDGYLDRAGLKVEQAPFSFGVRFSKATPQIESSLTETELTTYCKSCSWKSLIREGSSVPLILGGPLKWHQPILRVPPAKRLVIIQPGWHAASLSQVDLFQTPTGRSIGMGAEAVRVDEEAVSLTVWEAPSSGWSQQPREEENSDETLEPPNHRSQTESGTSVSSTHKIKVLFKAGWRALDTGLQRVIIDQNKNVRIERIQSAEELSVGSSLALWEDGAENDIDLDEGAPEGWQKEMENWKKPLRKLQSQPYILERRLRELGAGSSANETNIKNWMEPSDIRVNAPRDLENDFRAVLRYAQIPEGCHRYYMDLVSRVRTAHRESGRDAVASRFETAVSDLESELKSGAFTDGAVFETHGFTFQIHEIHAVGMDFS